MGPQCNVARLDSPFCLFIYSFLRGPHDPTREEPSKRVSSSHCGKACTILVLRAQLQSSAAPRAKGYHQSIAQMGKLGASHSQQSKGDEFSLLPCFKTL